jgi:hypothetical protein
MNNQSLKELSAKHHRTSIITLVVVTVIAVASAGYFGLQYFDLKAHPDKLTDDQTKALTSLVAKHYSLPTDETPVVGKVQDKDKLKDQPFFKAAENGDDILIYQKNRLALVYRKAQDKIINVGPVAIDTASPAQQSTKK